MRATTNRAGLGLLLVALAFQLGNSCNNNQNARPGIGAQLFTSPQTNPVALSNDGQTLYVANTTAGEVSLLQASPPYARLGGFSVGLDFLPSSVLLLASAVATVFMEVPDRVA